MSKASIAFAAILLSMLLVSSAAEAANSAFARQLALIEDDCDSADSASAMSEDDENANSEEDHDENMHVKAVADYDATAPRSVVAKAEPLSATSTTTVSATPTATVKNPQSENSSITVKFESKQTYGKAAVRHVACKRYFPSSAVTLSVSCE